MNKIEFLFLLTLANLIVVVGLVFFIRAWSSKQPDPLSARRSMINKFALAAIGLSAVVVVFGAVSWTNHDKGALTEIVLALFTMSLGLSVFSPVKKPDHELLEK
jgi:Ca2+/Na+ antiporter